MGLFTRILGSRRPLTPDQIARWVVIRQRSFLDASWAALRLTRADAIPLAVPAEAVIELSVHSYLCHLVIVAIGLHNFLDDRRWMSPGTTGDIDLLTFVSQVHHFARKIVQPEMVMDSPAFSPFFAGAFAVEFEPDLAGTFLFYYGSFFVDLPALREVKPASVEYAETMLAEMNTPHPLAKPVSLAYYEAHRMVFGEGTWQSKYNRGHPDGHTLSVLTRTWQGWSLYFIDLTNRLRAFTGSRRLEL